VWSWARAWGVVLCRSPDPLRLQDAGPGEVALRRRPGLLVKYKGFTLPTGALYVETHGVVDKLFQEVGAAFPVRDFPSSSASGWAAKTTPCP